MCLVRLAVVESGRSGFEDTNDLAIDEQPGNRCVAAAQSIADL